MLGTRTKQVYAYGKRGHRIVNVSDNHDGAELTSQTVAVIPAARASATHLAETYKLPNKRPKVDAKVALSPVSSPEPVVKVRRKKPSSKGVESSAKLSEVNLPAKFPRKPLSVVSANIQPMPEANGKPASAGVKKKRKPVVIGKGTPPKSRLNTLKVVSPVVDVEITILDDRGKPMKQERRVSRPDIQMNSNTSRDKPLATLGGVRKLTGNSRQKPIVLLDSSSDDEDNYVPPSRRTTTPHRSKRRVIVTSDEDSETEVIGPSQFPKLSSSSSQPSVYNTAKPGKKPLVLPPNPSVEVSVHHAKLHIPTAPSRGLLPTVHLPQRNAIHFSPLARRDTLQVARPLTPYRSRTASRARYLAPPSPSSPTTPTQSDDELSFDFSQLALSPNTLGQINDTLAVEPEKLPPAYLRPLLEACSQTTPHEFSAFIETLPFDPIVQTSHGGVGLKPAIGRKSSSRTKAHFQKIGEASYSEVFGIGDVVLKVVPLRDEEANKAVMEVDDVPAPSDAKDVLREIVVTRAMGEMVEGFVQLLRTYVVRGKYPSVLLDLWDEYDERKGSEGVRPDGFGVSQLYAIIMLPNGGPDLETFAFAPGSKNGWTQACSLFWQVTRTLAEAEDLVHFEHRDLHWGQILVKTVTDFEQPRVSRGRKVPMDHDVHGVRATVIDLGLSRMESGEADGLHFTVPEEEIFEGEGEYQFDVYRMMRTHNGNAWMPFRPLTNVMWLHYLVLKLLHEKRLRVPTAPRKTLAGPSTTFTERECYLSLVETGVMLGHAVASCKTVVKKGRKKSQAMAASTPQIGGPMSANDVLEIGLARGWVS
ncbi:hypothetical protein BC835DRAFT_1356408 [Cytidiella melzeri]|nr:hypothetical protein BC835DRAFT_1356408 [Cytidiella melzeri]